MAPTPAHSDKDLETMYEDIIISRAMHSSKTHVAVTMVAFKMTLSNRDGKGL